MPENDIVFISEGLSVATIDTNSGDIKLEATYDKFNELGMFQPEIESGELSLTTLTGFDENTQLFSQGTLLQDNIEPEKKFLYKIDIYEPDELNQQVITQYEIGIGKIVIRSGYYYLDRITSLYRYSNQQESRTNSTDFINFINSSFPCVTVSPTTITNTNDYFINPNSVLTSSYEYTPSPVVLEEFTLLGRMDGNIQSIDSSELRQILTDANIINAIESSTGNFTFLCQTLNLSNSNSRLSSAALQARPVYNNSNRPVPQRGMIIYNDQTNRIEVYNGTAWKAVKWSDE